MRIRKSKRTKKCTEANRAPFSLRDPNVPAPPPVELTRQDAEMTLVGSADDGEGEVRDEGAELEDEVLLQLLGSTVVRSEGAHTRRRKTATAELDPAMAVFINADVRLRVGACRRRPVRAVFDNANMGPYLLMLSHVKMLTSAAAADQSCVNENCPRCVLPRPTACCDLCNPQLFTDVGITTEPQQARKTRKTTVKTYTRKTDETDLRRALIDWGTETTIRRHGMATYATFGTVLVLDIETIDRIVDCAHVNRIKTAEDLKNETLWKKSELYAPQILDLIRQHCPPPADGPTTLSTHPSRQPNASTVPLHAIPPPNEQNGLSAAGTDNPPETPVRPSGSANVTLEQLSVSRSRARNKCGACCRT